MNENLPSLLQNLSRERERLSRPDHLLPLVLTSGCRAALLLTVEGIGDVLKVHEARGEADRAVGQESAVTEGLAGAAVAAKAPVRVENLLCLPMRVEEQVVGVVELADCKRDLSAEEEGLLQVMADRIGVSLRMERLIASYEIRIKKLFVMEAISRLLNSTLDEREVRLRAIEAITRLMESEAGSLLLLDEAKNELFFEVALGERGERIREIRLKVGEGIAGWVAQMGQPLIVNDVQSDPRFFKDADRMSDFKTRNMICVPVKVKGKVVGVLQAINKKGPADFTLWDLDEFSTLSNQVAVAIESANLYKELEETFLETAKSLSDAIEAKDVYTAGHTHRVQEYAVAVGKRLALPDSEMENLRMASVLHDIGKVGVEDRVLRKGGKLDPEEVEMMNKHAAIGAKIVSHIRSMRPVIPGIRHHHEHFDGRGYPSGVRGEEIPMVARIITVVDTFDAMTSDRPYRKRLPVEVAIAELKRCAGTQFDPKVVAAFLEALEAGECDKILGRGPD